MSPLDLSAASIVLLFARAGQPLESARAHALSCEIQTYGDLERAISALAHDQAYSALADALAYRALLIEQNDPERLIARLLRQAKDLDARADPAWTEAADFSGRAAYCRSRGDFDLADQLDGRARASQSLAAECEEQAFRKRLQVAEMTAQFDLSRMLRSLAA